MIDYPNDENGRVLRDMALSGDNLNKEREIDFSIVFNNHSNALMFCEEIKKEGVNLDYYKPKNKGEKSDVTVKITMIPSYSAISFMESRLEKLARPYGGQNDGWGCFAVTEP